MYTVRLLEGRNELVAAVELAYKTFMEFEAPVYTAEGVNNFREFLYGGEIERRVKDGTIFFFGAYCGERLVCICAVRDYDHITLMFTHRDFHRQGIGRMCLEKAVGYARDKYGSHRITLNSSPYGLPFYKALGFVPTDAEQTDGGIIFTPMEYLIKD